MLAPVVLLLGVVAAWAIDTGAAGGEVLRNVQLAGVDIGGLGTDQLVDRVESLDAEMSDRPVRIKTPEQTYDTTAGRIGLSIDEIGTADAALDEGRSAVLPVRPIRWVAGFFAPLEVDIDYAVDRSVARNTIRELEAEARVAPVEPTIESLDGQPFRAVPGAPGSGIDPDTLAAALVAAAQNTPIDEPVEVSIRQTPLAPRLDDSVAEEAAARANSMTDTTMSVTAGDMTIQLVPRELRRLVTAEPAEDMISIALDADAVLAVLEAEFAPLEVPAADASFTVEGGVPRLIPAVTGVACCGPDAAREVERAFQAGQTDVTIQLTETQPELTTADAEALGIVEEIGSPDAFGPTTGHKCCQNRVINIHRIADIVRGAIIEPGETFSLNGVVGERTRENGFTTGFIISNGIFKEDLGGGVSQMATTTFNAMFFAGLKDIQHKPHSFYIDRYPVGREATVAWPSVDLSFQNDTDYGILIESFVTPSTPSSQGSATVRMYSTKVWDISAQNSERYAYVGPGTRTLRTPDCYPNTGYSGFQIDDTRVFRRHGESAIDHTEKFHTTYTPADTVICKPPKSDDGD